MNNNLDKALDILEDRREKAYSKLQLGTVYDIDVVKELIEIEFDKLEDENLCLKVDLESKDDIIEWYRSDAEERCKRVMGR